MSETEHQNDTDEPTSEESETNDFLYVCADCSNVTYSRMPECPACESTKEKLTLAVVNEEGER
ncbi:hypothetical protein [Halobacterium litoreum]|uniref:DUF35 domain-containing protein n=1 Tax=Halobacterium litoreum TaxID=2039234 RepID=A0ABD5NHJ1_9EURY|nr:hypothetical protein [Halobacterium litoreum]UHH12409.1 hypothetical protein LT972_09585 [Halobacterium litoreum]